MSAPLYSLEEAVERAAVSSLAGITALSAITILRHDDSDEAPLPRITLRAEKGAALGDDPTTGVWSVRLSATLTAPGDMNEDEDADGGADAFTAYWKALTDSMAASGFRASLNTAEVCHVWGVVPEPVSYDNSERAFSRTVSVALSASYAYAT